MSDPLRVDAQALGQVAEFAERVSDALIDRQQLLAGHMAELLESGWRGSGAEACASAWQAWTDGFRHIIAGLADEAMALRLAASEYVASDTLGSEAITESGARF